MPQTHPPPGAIVLSDARRGGAIADPRTCPGTVNMADVSPLPKWKTLNFSLYKLRRG